LIRFGISGAIALAALVLATVGSAATQGPRDDGQGGPRDEGRGASAGAVYTLTNSSGGNAVAVFGRANDGSLVAQGTVPTGGNGTGAGLGSQGALVLDRDRLFAVNAGSGSISELKITGHGLQLIATVPSGGLTPISLTVSGRLLYVLNAGGTPNITGFSVEGDSLTPIAGATRGLGPGASGPAEVAFSSDGRSLVVTEKGSSTIDVFSIGRKGLPSLAAASSSSGGTPFGFAFDNRNDLFVSEAAGSASSYALDGGLFPVSAAVSTNGQAAPCWLVVSNDGQYAYTANAGSGTISGFSIDHDANIALLDPSGVSADLGVGSHPLDEAISQDGRFLFILTDGRNGVTSARLNANGTLTVVGLFGSLPAGSVGLAAR
jgi:6-phosphogluconolactonase (cycloisomerase 2 family)